MSDTEIDHDVLDHQLELIQPYLDKEGVTEVWINQPQSLLYKKYDSVDAVKVDIPDLDYTFLKHLAKLIATFNSRAINTENPILTGSLPEGQRVQVVMPPAVEKGTISFSIRVPSPVNKTLEELEEEGAFSECKPATNDLESFEHTLVQLNQDGKIREFIELAVKSRRNIIIAGETGSGKTTIAKSMIKSIPKHERLITLESEIEIDLSSFPNKVHMLYSREDNGKTFISPKQCLHACLRMNPSRILMAEILGDEAWDFLKSINTGHAGSITTMHANGAKAAFERLTAMVKESPAGVGLDHEYIKSQIMTTIDVVLFYSNMKLVNIYYEPTRKYDYMD